MQCESHEILVKKLDDLHTDLKGQNDRIFALLESQIKQKDSNYSKVLNWVLGVSGIVILGYFGLTKFLSMVVK